MDTDTPKQGVAPTDDNWHDYLPMDYVEELVKETPVGPDGYDGDDKDRHPLARVGGEA